MNDEIERLRLELEALFPKIYSNEDFSFDGSVREVVKRWECCDRCGCNHQECHNCKITCPNCGAFLSCSDLFKE